MTLLRKLEIGVFEAIITRIPALKKRGWHFWYDRLSMRPGQATHWTFMNYGYAFSDSTLESRFQASLKFVTKTQLAPSQIAMARHYYNLCISDSSLEFSGKDVIEFSSGRGGGAAYIAEAFGPQSYLGVELSAKAVAFSEATHGRIRNLNFTQGDIAQLPLSDRSANVVICMESSHCYPSIARFSSEAWRLLKPGGTLLYADFYPTRLLNKLESELISPGFDIIKKSDLTEGVLTSLAKEHTHKLELISSFVPRPLRFFFRSFAGCRGTFMDEHFRNGSMSYPHYVLRKKDLELAKG